MTTTVSKNLAEGEFVFHPEITYISKAGHNSFFAVIGGRLYSTHGSNSSNATYTSGRGTTGQCGYYGLDNLKLVNIPTHSPIKKVVGGFYQQAACLLENGDLYVWGKNATGQLGLGNTTIQGTPVLSTTDVTDVYDHPSMGGYDINSNKMIILKSDGLLYGAGYNANGQLGIGNTTTTISTWTQVLNITAGTVKSVWNLGGNTGALVVQKTDNTVWVCGYNGNGALGNATTTVQNQLIDLTSAWIPDTNYEIKSIAYCGSYYATSQIVVQTMGMFSDDGTNQTVRMCGKNDRGQLGDTTTTQRTTPVTPTGIPTTGIVDFMAPGDLLTLKLLTSAGSLWTWGYNDTGVIGDATTTNVTTPKVVETGVDKILDAGTNSHTYGYRCQSFIYKDDGFIYGTGYNATAYLGIGNTTTTITSYTRVKLDLLDGEIPMDMGAYTTTSHGRSLILLTNYNNLYTWGHNSQYGTHWDTTLAVQVPLQVKLPKING